MTVTLTIRNVPDHVAARLTQRARRRRRSLDAELLSILAAAAREEDSPRIGPADLVAAVRKAGLPPGSPSTALIRQMRGR